MTGPKVSGLTLELRDGSSDTTLSRTPVPLSARQWITWKIELPEGISEVTFVATDDGNGWGQWFAVGFPE